MAHIDVIILGYYLGLFLFVLNGIQWMALHNKRHELKAMEERILKLLIRAKLRR